MITINNDTDNIFKKNFGTYLMASHMSSPIFTQFLAWFWRDIGSPETQ